ncbi:MAG: M20/M25/M40 family metallo-hydrolase [Actinomycetales bacterium]|nr:M20/M25/M40 family metallo-hydrolase [Actinomycetales bacterium]
MSGTLADDEVRARVDALMPWVVDGLSDLVRIPSVATEGFPPEPVLAAHDAVVRLLTEAGVPQIDDLVIEGKTGPVVVGTVPGPVGAPTVLLYSHYDVVPAGDEGLWETPPFEPVQRDGAVYGRGTADSKANIMGILAAVRVFEGTPPVTVRIVIEGQEEYGSPFDVYPPRDPATFAADVMVIADVGSVRPGVPTMTTALRGSASVRVDARTMSGDAHSGLFGGAAPDARQALIAALATLHDAQGNVTVAGLLQEPWPGIELDEDEFRGNAGVLEAVPLSGSGSLGTRIWTGPAITVIGFDAPAADAPVNAVASRASAVLNLRVHPRQSAAEAQQALVDHLEALRPFGVEIDVTAGEAGDGFMADQDGRVVKVALDALGRAWECDAGMLGSGGSIPIVTSLQQAVPEAQILLFGATDGHAAIHAPNERVLLEELRRSIIAKAILMRELGSDDDQEGQ